MGNQITPFQELNRSLKNLNYGALPKHISPEKFAQVAYSAVRDNDMLSQKVASGQLNKASFFAACTKAAEMGLLPDGRQGAFVPYKGEVKFQPMYQGLLELVRNAADVKDIRAQVVYANDFFEYWEEVDGTKIKHRPNLEEPGDPIHAYAICRMVNGGFYVSVMSRTEIEDIKNKYAKGTDKPSSPWNRSPMEMWKKTVLRRLCKLLPQSTELRTATEAIDAEFEVDKPLPLLPKAEPTSSRLHQAIEGGD